MVVDVRAPESQISGCQARRSSAPKKALQVTDCFRRPAPFLGANDAHFVSIEVLFEKFAGIWVAITFDDFKSMYCRQVWLKDDKQSNVWTVSPCLCADSADALEATTN